MLNLQHVLPAFVEEKTDIVNTIVEINSGTINKYEAIVESGQLKLDTRLPFCLWTHPANLGPRQRHAGHTNNGGV